nr:hypothetical protein Iba_scaffold43535CG0010 [Ipomoea batatas]GMD99519.1 hypothetical protein Iba_chr15eCG4600 [Ipomoea batatas]
MTRREQAVRKLCQMDKFLSNNASSCPPVTSNASLIRIILQPLVYAATCFLLTCGVQYQKDLDLKGVCFHQ